MDLHFPAWNLWLPWFVELLSTVLGLISVWLLAKGDGRGWPLGVMMVLLSGVLFWYRNIQGQALLNLYFLFAQLIGWRRWSIGQKQDMRETARRLQTRGRIALLVFWLSSSWLVARLLAFNNSEHVELDALATVGSLLAQALIVARFVETWPLYLVVDIVLVGLSVRSELWFYAFMYAVYCVLAWYGWCEWTRDRDGKGEATLSKLL